jgi:hypothetical protein
MLSSTAKQIKGYGFSKNYKYMPSAVPKNGKADKQI